MKCSNKGFTLAELLIVVAIIAVLVGAAIPVLTNTLERGRESTDLSNVRTAYLSILAAANSGDTSGPLWQSDGTYKCEVSLQQKRDGWTAKTDGLQVGSIRCEDTEHWKGIPTAGGTATVTFDPNTEQATIDWGGTSGGSGGGASNSGTVANVATANKIGDKVVDLITDYFSGTGGGNGNGNGNGGINSTKVRIRVDSNGNATIEAHNNGNNGQSTALAEYLKNGLQQEGLLSVEFNSSDTTYGNGYIITVNMNNGNGKKVSIEPL